MLRCALQHGIMSIFFTLAVHVRRPLVGVSEKATPLARSQPQPLFQEKSISGIAIVQSQEFYAGIEAEVDWLI